MVIIWAKIGLGNATKKKGVSPPCPTENSVRADSKHKWLLKPLRISKLSVRIASEYGVNPAQVSQWKKQVLEELPQLFTNGRSKTASDNDQLVPELYRQIGQLKVELDWLEKKTGSSELSVGKESAIRMLQ